MSHFIHKNFIINLPTIDLPTIDLKMPYCPLIASFLSCPPEIKQRMAWIQLALVAMGVVAFVRYLQRQQRVAKMPPFIPWSALSLPEKLLYPLLGHAIALGNPYRMNQLLKQHGKLMSNFIMH